MAVKIQWQPPLVPEERKRAQWEKIIRNEAGEVDDAPEVSLRFEADNAQASQSSGAQRAAQFRGRLVDALRATGKPVA